jgi:phage terminase large subunit
MELQRLGYVKQYTREAQDTYTGKTEKRFGFKTTSLTRPTIISRLIEVVREHCNTICDKNTLEELLTIIRNEKGRIEAPEGGHDDMMMGLAIAHHIRDQVVFPADVINVHPKYHFNVERNMGTHGDYGEKVVVI